VLINKNNLGMEIFNIDTEKIKEEIINQNYHSFYDFTRKIITILVRHRNELIIETSQNYNNILVGINLYTEISDNSSFYKGRPNTKLHKFEQVGILCGIDVFIESYGLLKPNQYIFFNDIGHLLSEIKKYQRDKKLERILK